jgi:hypothetical protein
LARRVAAALIVLALTATGCGQGGVSSGAAVSVYVAAPLCEGAQRQLTREGGKVEGLHVRAICLPATESKGRLDLARTGANARRATEDSTTVAYLAAAGRGAKFSQTIVESADIAWTTASSGRKAMRLVLEALAGGSSSPRADVREALDEVS